MTNAPREQTVLVTGGSGYLAGWIIRGLLREEFNVRTTLRSLRRKEEVIATLQPHVPSVANLSFVVADLLHDEGWREAASGCEYVIHVASPMGQRADERADLVAAAQEGTLRVLRATSDAGVRRVVCTSSGYAAKSPSVAEEEQPVADENTWTDMNDKGLNEYAKSKVLAERAAWDFIKSSRSGTTLATIVPGLILGPVMGNTASGSLGVISRLLTRKLPALPNAGFSITNTQGLVDLHLRAMLRTEAANQRFIGVGDFLWFRDIAETLRRRFPDRNKSIPTRRLPDWFVRALAPFQEDMRFLKPMLGKREQFDSRKAFKLLQWKPGPSREAVISCGESLISNRLV
jgi:dihydroflavonol-4-reductase